MVSGTQPGPGAPWRGEGDPSPLCLMGFSAGPTSYHGEEQIPERPTGPDRVQSQAVLGAHGHSAKSPDLVLRSQEQQCLPGKAHLGTLRSHIRMHACIRVSCAFT